MLRIKYSKSSVEIGQLLGQGRSGAKVYRCRCKQSGDDLAVKILELEKLGLKSLIELADAPDDDLDERASGLLEDALDRFDVAKHAQDRLIQQENILILRGMFIEDNKLYLLSDYIDSCRSLRQLVSKKQSENRYFSETQTADFARQILEGLKYLRRQGCRDDFFTLSRGLVSSTGDGHSSAPVVKLGFLCSLSTLGGGVADFDTMNCEYVPPEERGKVANFPKEHTDAYALGAAICELVSNAPPKAHENGVPKRASKPCQQIISLLTDSVNSKRPKLNTLANTPFLSAEVKTSPLESPKQSPKGAQFVCDNFVSSPDLNRENFSSIKVANMPKFRRGTLDREMKDAIPRNFLFVPQSSSKGSTPMESPTNGENRSTSSASPTNMLASIELVRPETPKEQATSNSNQLFSIDLTLSNLDYVGPESYCREDEALVSSNINEKVEIPIEIEEENVHHISEDEKVTPEMDVNASFPVATTVSTSTNASIAITKKPEIVPSMKTAFTTKLDLFSQKTDLITPRFAVDDSVADEGNTSSEVDSNRNSVASSLSRPVSQTNFVPERTMAKSPGVRDLRASSVDAKVNSPPVVLSVAAEVVKSDNNEAANSTPPKAPEPTACLKGFNNSMGLQI